MEWTWQNDLGSVTVGINCRLDELNKQKLIPSLIRLGEIHTRLFLREHWLTRVPTRKPQLKFTNYVIWDDAKKCLCYNVKPPIPIMFNDTSIYGIIVEGVYKSV